MQTPEGFMRDLIGHCDEVTAGEGGAWCRTHTESITDGICPKAEESLALIRARDEEVRATNSEWEDGFAAGRHDVLRLLDHEWGNTFNDYRTDENIVIYTSPSRQSAIERADNSSELIAVQRRISGWEPIKTEVKMTELTQEPKAGEVWREADGVLLLCIEPGVRWKSFTEYVEWDAPLIARPLTRLVDAKGNLVNDNDELKKAIADRDEAQMERSDVSLERDKLQEHIDDVYDMLDVRFTAAKCGSKAEKALGEIMTFMETNPV